MYDEKKAFQTTYHKGDILAITIKPDDKMQGFGTPRRYQDFVAYYHTKFNRLFEDSKQFSFYFRLELSEPIGDVCTSPRLHLHGVIKLHTNLSVFKWLNDVMPDLLVHARLKIDRIRDNAYMDGWYEYIHKQFTFMPTNATLSNMDWKYFMGVEESGDLLERSSKIPLSTTD